MLLLEILETLVKIESEDGDTAGEAERGRKLSPTAICKAGDLRCARTLLQFLLRPSSPYCNEAVRLRCHCPPGTLCNAMR